MAFIPLPTYNRMIGLEATLFIVVSNSKAKEAVISQLPKINDIIIAVVTSG